MTVTEKLKSLLNERYVTEEDEIYGIVLKPGLSKEALANLASRLPKGYIPAEIKELLTFTSGFEFNGLEEVRFSAVGPFGMEDFFPHAVRLCDDGFGNYWILDINRDGNWGAVFYVCHDPAVIVKHSKNLTQFMEHLDDFGKNKSNAHLDTIHEKGVFEIWEKNHGFMEWQQAIESEDRLLKSFALTLPETFMIADLRNTTNGAGFAYGKFTKTIAAIRHETELMWAIEKPVKRGFMARLFGK